MKARVLIAAATLLPLAVLAHSHQSDAEVKRVDREAGKITLKHGEIRNIDMPPMTMVFQVRDKAALATVKEGDKVKFTAEREKGAYIVTSIEVAK